MEIVTLRLLRGQHKVQRYSEVRKWGSDLAQWRRHPCHGDPSSSHPQALPRHCVGGCFWLEPRLCEHLLHVHAWAPATASLTCTFLRLCFSSRSNTRFLTQVVRRIIYLISLGHVCARGWSTTGEPRGRVILSSEQGLIREL